MRRVWRRRADAAGLIMLGLASAMPAASADLKVGRRFEAWTGGCERAPEGRARGCFIFQKLKLRETRKEVASIAVGYPRRGEPPPAAVQVPLGTLLPPGITLRVEDGETLSFPIQFCTREGCRAHVPLDPPLLAAMKAGLVAELSFQGIDRKPISLGISLRGFTRGLASLR